MKRLAWNFVIAAIVGLLAAVLWQQLTAPSQPVHQLAPLEIDRSRVAVIGFSSGAIMAQQVHLAYSDRIMGAVLLSGPPYQCAEGSLDLALSRCLKGEGKDIDVTRLVAQVQERASRGELAPLSGLAGDRVLAIHGRADALVPEATARASLGLYEALPGAASMALHWDGDGEFAHVWPTIDTGGECNQAAAPYLGRCGRDLAAEAMTTLFGEPSRGATAPEGELRLVHLSQFDPDGKDPLLDELGYQYLPRQCVQGEACGLLIAFHGCEQNRMTVEASFARDTGLNRWADVHSVVVLYPQTRATYLPLNPKACWDWWGYSGPDYDTRKGVQLRAIANMAAALGAPLDR